MSDSIQIFKLVFDTLLYIFHISNFVIRIRFTIKRHLTGHFMFIDNIFQAPYFLFVAPKVFTICKLCTAGKWVTSRGSVLAELSDQSRQRLLSWRLSASQQTILSCTWLHGCNLDQCSHKHYGHTGHGISNTKIISSAQ